MNPELPHFIRSLSQAFTSIRVKSVVDPLIKLLVIMLVFIIVSAYLKLPEWLIVVLLWFSGAILVLVLLAYVGFAIFKPDYLRSESYNLRKQSLSILGDKENYKKVDMRHLVDIANPYTEELFAIEEKGGEDE
jgi:hypothetical protein